MATAANFLDQIMESFHRSATFKKACPVTGGVLLPASEDMLKKVWTGCMELTCFEEAK